jgi:hypothetical protein
MPAGAHPSWGVILTQMAVFIFRCGQITTKPRPHLIGVLGRTRHVAPYIVAPVADQRSRPNQRLRKGGGIAPFHPLPRQAHSTRHTAHFVQSARDNEAPERLMNFYMIVWPVSIDDGQGLTSRREVESKVSRVAGVNESHAQRDRILIAYGHNRQHYDTLETRSEATDHLPQLMMRRDCGSRCLLAVVLKTVVLQHWASLSQTYFCPSRGFGSMMPWPNGQLGKVS